MVRSGLRAGGVTVVLITAVVVAGCGSSSSAGAAAPGEDAVVVPRLVGLPMRTAADDLACEGLTPYPERTSGGSTSTAAALALNDPPVVSTNPPAGSRVALGTTVYLSYLSPPSDLIAVSTACQK